MPAVYHAIAIIGAIVLVISGLSHVLHRSPFQETVVALFAGIVAGPYGLGWLDLETLGDPIPILLEAARLTVAVNLMGTALRLTRQDLRALAVPAALLLTLGMVLMAGASSLVAWVVLGVSPLVAALIGTSLTSTDPVVSSAIVSGKLAQADLPRRVRSGLSLEAGANDGLAYPLVMLPVAFVLHAQPWHVWLVQDVLIDVVGGALFGAAVGVAAASLLRWADRHGAIGRMSFLAYTVALSLLILGLARVLKLDGLLSVFTGGLAYSLIASVRVKSKEENVQEAVGSLFTLPLFVLLGAALPWAAWQEQGWLMAALALAVLLLRRLPMWLALWPVLRRTYTPRDGLFLGWFGPIGVAPLFYAAHVTHETGQHAVWPAATAVITASILVHGMTAAPFTRWYGRRRRG